MKDVGGPAVYRLVEAGGRRAVCPGGSPSRSRRRPGFGLYSGSMLGILYTFWGMGFFIFMKKGSFFLPGVMWAKYLGYIAAYRGIYRDNGKENGSCYLLLRV